MIEIADDEDVTSWVYESLLIQPNKIPLYVTLQHSLSTSVPASSFQYDNVVSSSPSTEPEDWLLGTTSSHEPVVMNPEFDILGHSQDIGHQTPTDRSDDNANSIPSSSQCSKPKNIQDYDNLNLASVNTSGDITVGQLYPSKKDLKLHLGMLAMRKNYEFKVRRSAKDRFEVVCVGKNCKWGLRATKLKDLTYFEVRKFQNEHSCSLDELHRDHRQASSALIGQYVKLKFEGQVSRIYRPKDIVDDVRVQLGVNMSYNKAWRAREAALEIARGSPEESFAILPSYCSMLERNNPGTVTHIETDADNHFLYFFMALGVSIRGFHSSMRPVIAIDGAFLKSKYFGTLLVTACQDGENQIYPLAFGVVDSENDASWSWFMTLLKGAIGNVENLAFISDRHGSIAKALHSVFPEAHHGACIFHISGNLKHKFGNTTKMLALFFKAAKEYQVSEFNKLMEDIGKLKNGDIKKYLEEIGYYRWARAHFPGYRYGMMTSNIAESLNSKLKEARKLPITALVDHLREVSQQWFVERRNKGSSLSTHLTKWAEEKVRENNDNGLHMRVAPIDLYAYQIHDQTQTFTVDLNTRTCTCREFELDQLPCSHATVACRAKGVSVYSMCSHFYTSNALVLAYAEAIWPVGNKCEWVVPEDVQEMVVLCPTRQVVPGRRKTVRIPSIGEDVSTKRCTRCNGVGHYRSTCRNPIPLNT